MDFTNLTLVELKGAGQCHSSDAGIIARRPRSSPTAWLAWPRDPKRISRTKIKFISLRSGRLDLRMPMPPAKVTHFMSYPVDP